MKRALIVPVLLAFVAGAAAEDQDPIHQKQLDNGLNVVIVQKHQAPIVTIEIAVKTGAFTETKETNGLSHLYEHMFFKGNAAIPTQEAYMARMHELGISFNGTTGDEKVNYFITLPSKNFAAGMKFFSDALLSPLFNQEELEKERKVVIGEYDRNESSPDYFLGKAMGEAAYGVDYVRKNALGVRETILSATRETMQKFKETYYVPNNSLLSIVGDVNLTEAQSYVDRYYGPSMWKQAEDPHAAHPRNPLPILDASKAVVVQRERVREPSLSCMWNGPGSDRDTQATYAGHIWSRLCGMEPGRFQKTMKEGGLALRASLSYRLQRDGAEIDFHASRPKSAEEVRDALLWELAAMVDDPHYFTEDQLAIAKKMAHAERAYGTQSGLQQSHALTSAWASSSLDYYRSYLDEIDRVSLQDVRAFVRNYMLGKPYVIGWLQDDKEPKLDESVLLGTPPEKTSAGLAAAVTSFKLSNGVRAIVRRERGAPISAMEIFVDGGSAYLTQETQGIERLALGVALEGSKDLPRDAYHEKMEELGARTSHDAGPDFSRVGVQAPSESFQDAAKIVLGCLKDPEISKIAFDLDKKQMLSGFRRERQNPDALVGRLVNEVLYAGHAYEVRAEGRAETVEKLDADACRAALKKMFTPSRVLVVVVSPLAKEDVQAWLEDQFSWVAGTDGDAAKKDLGAFHPAERSKFEKAPTKTTYVLGKFAMPAPADKEYPAAKVMMRILSERFWDEIRTKRALSYAVRAGLGQSRANSGSIYVTSTDPRKSIEVMFEAMTKLQNELVPATDIKAVVAQDMTARAMQSESASGTAAALGAAELLFGNWKRIYEESDDLAKITPEQVREVAKKYLNDVRWGVVGPEPVEDKVLEKSN
jgi:zinc protease